MGILPTRFLTARCNPRDSKSAFGLSVHTSSVTTSGADQLSSGTCSYVVGPKTPFLKRHGCQVIARGEVLDLDAPCVRDRDQAQALSRRSTHAKRGRGTRDKRENFEDICLRSSLGSLFFLSSPIPHLLVTSSTTFISINSANPHQPFSNNMSKDDEYDYLFKGTESGTRHTPWKLFKTLQQDDEVLCPPRATVNGARGEPISPYLRSLYLTSLPPRLRLDVPFNAQEKL